MKSVIEITSDNYKQYSPLSPIAILFSHTGAMGEPGCISALCENSTLYHTNYKKGNITLAEAFELCPPLKNCEFTPVYSRVQNEWFTKYLGFGNFLIISKDIQEKFNQLSINMEPQILFKKWDEVAQNCLE